MMLCGLHPSERLSVAWLETVHAEVVKSSLVLTEHAAIAAIFTCMVAEIYLRYFNHIDISKMIQ